MGRTLAQVRLEDERRNRRERFDAALNVPVHGDAGHDEIRGRFRSNGLNRPTLVISRRTGTLVIGGMIKFSCRCDPGDGHRRFWRHTCHTPDGAQRHCYVAPETSCVPGDPSGNSRPGITQGLTPHEQPDVTAGHQLLRHQLVRRADQRPRGEHLLRGRDVVFLAGEQK